MVRDPLYFSSREQVRSAPERDAARIPPEEFSERVATTLDNMMRRLGELFDRQVISGCLYDYIFEIPLIRQTVRHHPDYTPYGTLRSLLGVFGRLPWSAVFDIAEATYAFVLSPKDPKGKFHLGPVQAKALKHESTRWHNDINDLLAEFGLPWVFKDGKAERWFPEPLNTTLEEARSHLLDDKRFTGPDEQFAKAMKAFNLRPEPDTENCVKDAIGAVEGVARIISGDEKALLPDILKREPFRSSLHTALRQAVEKVYGYRGDESGVAHGQVGPSKVGIEEAELLLGIAASTILYLGKKFGAEAKG